MRKFSFWIYYGFFFKVELQLNCTKSLQGVNFVFKFRSTSGLVGTGFNLLVQKLKYVPKLNFNLEHLQRV